MAIFSFKGPKGLRRFDVRLRNGFFELWTQNKSAKERWHPVQKSPASDLISAANELYFWAGMQNWDKYDFNPKMDD